ncbi:MAG: dihydrofolate reductase [Ginsengibacter sp.]
MILCHIVAASENNVIGNDGELPWRLPNDFKYFKNTTWSMPVIMGRKTFESLKKDLPGRINIVLTKKEGWKDDNVQVAKDLGDAIEKATACDTKEIFIIGGGEIFNQTLPDVDRIYLTRVHTTIDGDTYYPELKKDEWALIKSDSFPADDKNNYPYTFEVWERIKK